LLAQSNHESPQLVAAFWGQLASKAHSLTLGLRTKTDAVDARLIADFGYHPWQPPPFR
jgi:hypothetical protein